MRVYNDCTRLIAFQGLTQPRDLSPTPDLEKEVAIVVGVRAGDIDCQNIFEIPSDPCSVG